MAEFRDIPQFTRGAQYQVDSRWDYCLDTLATWQGYDDAPLDLDPDFQRAHVWTEAKQIAYIEYKLRGGAGSHLLQFNCPGWQSGSYRPPFVLVDGKQRLEAVRRFLANEINVFGKWFRRDFTDRMPWECSFRLCVNNLDTREQVLQWYLDLNSGGVVHTDDEINKVRALLEAERNSAR